MNCTKYWWPPIEGRKRKEPISLFRCCENAVYKAIHKPPRKLSLVTQCYSLGRPDYPNKLAIICWTGDFNYKLMDCVFEDECRLKRLINYLPRTIVNRIGVDYFPYDLHLNDWRKELLKWFNVRKIDILNRLVDIIAKQSMGMNGYIARITFTDIEEGKNGCIIAFQNLTYKEEKDLLNLLNSDEE